MKSDISRDIISDLWPLYHSGEASADSRRLVESFLADDKDFHALLRDSELIIKGAPELTLSSDTELQLIAIARRRTQAQIWLIGGAIGMFGFVCLAFLGGALFYALSAS